MAIKKSELYRLENEMQRINQKSEVTTLAERYADTYQIPTLPLPCDLETKSILLQLNRANRSLAELKGVALTIPNESILINTLILQEAKESSAVENIITTHDELYKAGAELQSFAASSSAKEVVLYADALKRGFALIRKNKILTLNNIKEIQEVLERNSAGFRKVPGTNLQNQKKQVVYTPPQNYDDILRHMENLVAYINDETMHPIDPLIKMAIIHHQFESIHPFYDGNGRTGRIINSLYLVLKELLDLPILYLSRYIIRNKAEYYRLIQSVRDNGNWEDWVLFMLKGIDETATETIVLVKQIKILMQDYKVRMRELLGRQYSHELLNNLFNHPYTKIEFVVQDLNVSRLTATKYLNKLVDAGLLDKVKMKNSNYYLNSSLTTLLVDHSEYYDPKGFDAIESINRML